MLQSAIANIKKLFKYNWGGDIFKKLTPIDNEIRVPESVSKDIKNGAYILFLYAGLIFITTILSMFLISNALGYWTNFLGPNWRANIISNAVITLIVSAAIPFLLIYFLTGEKRRKPLPYFIVFVLSAIGIIYILTEIYSAFVLIPFSVFMALLNLIAVIIEFAAYASIAVGCIDFLLEANNKELTPELEIKKEGTAESIPEETTENISEEQPQQPQQEIDETQPGASNEANELLELNQSIDNQTNEE